MSTPVKTPKKKVPQYLNFIFGGVSGILGICAVHPLSVVKIRMQLSRGMGVKATMRSAMAEIVKKEGVVGLYKGLTASWLRQSTYTTMRLGIYAELLDLMKTKDGPPNFLVKIGLGVIAGACGATVGTPAEVCLIRMATDGLLAPTERRNYRHIGQALSRIVRKEGVLTLWTGYIPTLCRACVVNPSQLATYTQLKEMLLATDEYEDGFLVHFMSSSVAGLVTSCTSMPFDVAKTRIQFMNTANGVPEYKGITDALGNIARKEGVAALWKGFLPYFARTGTHTVLTFIILEQLLSIYHKLYIL